MGKPLKPPSAARERIFLVVVDDSPEVGVAVLFACTRAAHTGGRVALLYVIEPEDEGGAGVGDWMGVREVSRREAREEAEITLSVVSERVRACSGKMPLFFIREGHRGDELLKLIDEEKSISILVLAASAEAGGPGPLVTLVTGKRAGRLRVPVTVVPGSLRREDIDAIA